MTGKRADLSHDGKWLASDMKTFKWQVRVNNHISSAKLSTTTQIRFKEDAIVLILNLKIQIPRLNIKVK